jgi:hypothetical protein
MTKVAGHEATKSHYASLGVTNRVTENQHVKALPVGCGEAKRYIWPQCIGKLQFLLSSLCALSMACKDIPIIVPHGARILAFEATRGH